MMKSLGALLLLIAALPLAGCGNSEETEVKAAPSGSFKTADDPEFASRRASRGGKGGGDESGQTRDKGR